MHRQRTYDGPNDGVAVFNVGGLTGSVDLYRYAKPPRERQSSGKQYCTARLLPDDRLDPAQPNRHGSRWRYHGNAARHGVRCAWYGTALPNKLAGLKSFSTQEWPSFLGGHFCLYPVLLTSVTFMGRNRLLRRMPTVPSKRFTTDVGNLDAIA